MSIFSLALTFFIITNPIGNSPGIVALVKDFSFERQRFILLRETFFALLLALFFQFFGEIFLTALNLKNYTVSFCGGILQLLVGINMIFPKHEAVKTHEKKEPFIVPIATPLLSGPGLMTIIMLYSQQASNKLIVTAAILVAWIGVTAVMAAAPYLQKILGKKGLTALEQLMGMCLCMIAMGMLVKGAHLFLQSLP